MYDELNYVTALTAASAIPNTLCCVDGEAIFAATLWARADIFGADPFQLNAATPMDFVANRHGTRTRDPVVELSVAAHDKASKRDLIIHFIGRPLVRFQLRLRLRLRLRHQHWFAALCGSGRWQDRPDQDGAPDVAVVLDLAGVQQRLRA